VHHRDNPAALICKIPRDVHNLELVGNV
jgi:hypothetical protein